MSKSKFLKPFQKIFLLASTSQDAPTLLDPSTESDLLWVIAGALCFLFARAIIKNEGRVRQ